MWRVLGFCYLLRVAPCGMLDSHDATRVVHVGVCYRILLGNRMLLRTLTQMNHEHEWMMQCVRIPDIVDTCYVYVRTNEDYYKLINFYPYIYNRFSSLI